MNNGIAGFPATEYNLTPGRFAGAELTRATAQSVANNDATVAVSFSAAFYDTSAFWNFAAPTRVVVSVSGFYMVGGNVQFAANITGLRRLSVRRNGGDHVVSQEIPAVASARMLAVSVLVLLSAGDSLELMVFQDSGVALDSEVGATNTTPVFWIHRVG